MAVNRTAPGSVDDSAPHGWAGDSDGGNDPAGDSLIAQSIRVIRRRWYLAAAAFLLFSLAGGAAIRLRPLQYQASAKLLVERAAPPAITEDQKAVIEPRANDDVVVQSQLLQRRALVGQAILNGKLWESADLGGQPPPSPVTVKTVDAAGLIDRFQSHLRIETAESRWLLNVSFQSTDPVLAMRAVNLLTEGHVADQEASGFATSDDTVAWLRTRLEEQRQRLNTSEAALQTFVEKKDALSVDEHQNIVVQKLADLNASLTRAKTDRIAKEALYTQIKTAREGGGSLDGLSAVLENPVLQQLRQQLAELTRKEVTTAQDLGDKHPDLIKLRAEIDLTHARLNAELDKVTQAVSSDYQAALAVERSLTDALNTQKSEVLSLNRKSVDYRALEREAASDRDLYQRLLAQTQARGIVGRTPSSQVRIVEAAVLPRSPLGIPRRTAFLMVLLGALLLAVSVPLVVESLDSRIKTPLDVTKKLRLPCLTMVPISSGASRKKEPLLSTDPNAFGESFRRLRTGLLAGPTLSGTIRVLVTSAIPREGKTTVAANLALALAETNEKVLLIDGDLRRARLHKMLSLSRQPGLAEWLEGSATLSDSIQRTRFENLFVLAGGAVQHNPSHLLTGPSLERLRELDNQFRWIVIDSPPVGPVSDACMFAPYVERAVFVVGAEQAKGALVRQAVTELRRSGVDITGAVLNRVDLERAAYYYSPYYSSEYATYYQTREVAPEP